MAHDTISHHNKADNATGVVFRVTAQAAINVIRNTVTVCIRIRDK
jgi:hypothetical protein